MKRDLDLIRKILLTIEDEASGFAPGPLKIDGYTDVQVAYHAFLLVNAGLVNGSVITTNTSQAPAGMIRNLNWAGHEFAEAARDDTRWNKAMGIVKEKGGSITMDVLKDLLTSLMKGAIGLP